MARDVVYLKPETALSEQPTITRIPHPVPHSVPERRPSALENDLHALARLVANITEAYTAGIYLRKPDEAVLSVGGVQTLSRDYLPSAEIGFGCGLIGWTAENAVRISVSPFEHSATTLLCYRQDQGLKSFIAVPILDEQRRVLGVIACDSKKSYAFPKVTEKILLDCAEHARILLTLHRELSASGRTSAETEESLAAVIESLYGHQDETILLSCAAALPENIIERDALVIVVTTGGREQEGTFYSAKPKQPLHHWLFQMVCQHKKIICKERSVHVLPSDDPLQRSFLSIPFHLLGKEVGSFNLLSPPYRAFDAGQIAAVEKVAAVVGRELERIRLREQLSLIRETSDILSWKQFALLSRAAIEDAKAKRVPLTLLRIVLSNIADIEDVTGVQVSSLVFPRVARLVSQVKHREALACGLYDTQVLLLTESSEVQRTVNRLQKLIVRLSVSEPLGPGVRLNEMISRGLRITSAKCPKEGETLEVLTAKTLRSLEAPAQDKREAVANVRHWA